jgi:hypothetical protein
MRSARRLRACRSSRSASSLPDCASALIENADASCSAARFTSSLRRVYSAVSAPTRTAVA